MQWKKQTCNVQPAIEKAEHEINNIWRIQSITVQDSAFRDCLEMNPSWCIQGHFNQISIRIFAVCLFWFCDIIINALLSVSLDVAASLNEPARRILTVANALGRIISQNSASSVRYIKCEIITNQEKEVYWKQMGRNMQNHYFDPLSASGGGSILYWSKIGNTAVYKNLSKSKPVNIQYFPLKCCVVEVWQSVWQCYIHMWKYDLMV